MIGKKSAFTALAALALLSGCGLAPEEKINEAEASFAAHNYTGAKVYLVSALRDVPGDIPTLTLLAKTQIAMGDGEGAIASLSQIAEAARSDEHRMLTGEAELLRKNFDVALAAASPPSDANAARIVALAHLGLGDLDAAKAVIEAGQTLPGNKAGLLSVLAQIHLSEGALEQAQATAAAALKADPASLDALLASARTHQARYDLPATLAAYQKAAELYPQNFPAQRGVAASLAEMGRIEEAREALTKLAEMAPQSVDVIHLKARLKIEGGEYAAAREMLQGYETALRDDPQMQVTYATALLRVGQAAQARAWLEPVLDDYPYLRVPRSLLAEAKLESGDAAGAFRTIRNLAERPDARPEELTIAAKAARASGDTRAAERFAKRETLSTPEWIGGELAKADLALRNKQWRRAVESYEAIRARSSAPNAMVLNNLAFAKSQLGENDDAVSIALEAAQIAPDNPSILDTAGWLLVQTGKDKSRGIAMLERAAKLAPDNAGIADRLSRAKRI